jgi:hypothetical protein
MAKIEVLTKKDIRDLSVIGGGLEVIDWILYDTLTIANAGVQVSFRFFQQAIGQGGISLEKTNMEIPGQLPAGYRFVCQKVIAVPKQGLTLTIASAKDAVAITQRGRAQLFIGTRPYLQVPLQDLIGGTMNGFAATAVGATTLEMAYVAPRTVVSGELEYAPVLPANFSFSLLVEYDAAPVVAANLDLQIQMVGKLVRPMQG